MASQNSDILCALSSLSLERWDLTGCSFSYSSTFFTLSANQSLRTVDISSASFCRVRNVSTGVWSYPTLVGPDTNIICKQMLLLFFTNLLSSFCAFPQWPQNGLHTSIICIMPFGFPRVIPNPSMGTLTFLSFLSNASNTARSYFIFERECSDSSDLSRMMPNFHSRKTPNAERNILTKTQHRVSGVIRLNLDRLPFNKEIANNPHITANTAKHKGHHCLTTLFGNKENMPYKEWPQCSCKQGMLLRVHSYTTITRHTKIQGNTHFQ